MSANDFLSHPSHSAQKDYFKPTSHKSDFSFSSPQDDPPTVAKQALMESRRAEILRNRVELFAELKENTTISSVISKTYTKEFVDQMRTEQRVEVQKLLLEISRLHDLLEDQDKIHRHAIQRLKQESEQIALLRISNLKQSQFSQIQVIEHQLKKTREALEEKTYLLEELEKNSARKTEGLASQNEQLKADLKDLIERKNVEIYELKNQYNKQNQDTARKQNDSLQELKALADKELRKVLKRLEEKDKTLESLSNEKQRIENENRKLEQMLQKEKKELDERLELAVERQRARQEELTRNLKQFYLSEAEQSEQSVELQRQLYKTELEQLLKVIAIKDGEIQREAVFRETEKIDHRLQLASYEEQNGYLRRLVEQIKKQHLQEIQLLKVKMGVLHKTDIEALVQLYEAKIQALTKDIQYSEAEAERAGKQIKKEREFLYQLKKKYDYKISILHQEISELRIGASHHQKELKDKLENEKSMMMLTSRNFIKENEAKNNNIRFYEEELRKLRQLLEIQAQEVEESQKNVEEKIKLAEDELSRLSNKILEVKSEAEESQKKLKLALDQKTKQIKRLNELLNAPKSIEKSGDDYLSEIKKLDDQLTKKEDELRSFKNKYEDLQSTIKMVRADNERLIMENQINSEDAKKKYKAISDKNLADMKAFYDRRLQELENDKRELSRVISSQSEQITELIKKYKELEEGMRQLLKQTKKRSDLEARVIALGMDNNLVKNKAELFHK